MSRNSAAVRRANANPAVANLLIMHAGIVDAGGEVQHLRRQAADGIEHRIGCDDAVMLRRDESHPRIDQRLLRVEDVDCGGFC